MNGLGKVSEWNDERGFGFVQPQAGGPRLFFHIRDYRQQGRRPEVGEWVRYAAGTGRDGKPAASQVRRVVPPSASAQASRAQQAPRGWNGGWPGWAMLLAYAIALGCTVQSGRLPDWAALGVLVMSAVTWIAYALDKRAAGRQAQRTPEASLHLMELLGGWPGALIAQRSLRHKNRKRSYQLAFWWIVALHCAALACWIWKTASP
ncbi:cold shock and DUF1294 domain-containing protein [Pseudoxanthomonas sp.]|uniref:cold shock and DUF1294 domain-containing protein n=1 Tax=Pseudoxanthomonas sp. TaxID=1871049 RepID=UPI0026248C54|nr:cold shock and DUF1294 domain-containing protein [Pseudoxanthomonas sp.]WDS37436.1 MAG: cold shock and DUF1294 domain-containing protein [Pseudoxanthomonas sp.]